MAAFPDRCAGVSSSKHRLFHSRSMAFRRCSAASGAYLSASLSMASYFSRSAVRMRTGSEYDYASEICGICLRHHTVAVDDAKGRLRVTADGVQLMSAARTVKEELLPVIHIAHRHRIGIAAVAGQREDAGGPAVQDARAFRQGKRLFFTSHFPKHNDLLPSRQKEKHRFSYLPTA